VQVRESGAKSHLILESGLERTIRPRPLGVSSFILSLYFGVVSKIIIIVGNASS
jgi:hypothetical protein